MNDTTSSVNSSYDLKNEEDACPRGAFAIYCEDIRLEVTNQRTYVGVYGSDIFVPDFPSVIPQIAVLVTAWANYSNPFTKLTFRLIQGRVVLHEQVEDVEGGYSRHLSERKKNGLPESVDPSSRMAVHYAVKVAPYLVSEETSLRVRVETEDGELRAGGVMIRKLPPPG